MSCPACADGERHSVRKPKAVQREGRVAVVTDVPVEECPACGDVWLDEHVAMRLDELFTEMLSTELMAVRPYAETESTAA